MVKLGHQAPKKFRYNKCNSIELIGNYAYCKSHNFVYNTELEEKKLYDGKPCHYTDNRYIDTIHNYFNNVYICCTRFKDISIKAAIRRTLNCRNIPIGSIISFNKSWYISRNPRIDLSYKFKIKKENNFDPKYKVNHSDYKRGFTSCKRSQKLVNALRKNGFLVQVFQNESFIGNMLTTAKVYMGKDISKDNIIIPGECAIAYGYGKKIGFSSFEDDYMGYTSGEQNILWDNFGEFDKWSRCETIDKKTPIKKILKILK